MFLITIYGRFLIILLNRLFIFSGRIFIILMALIALFPIALILHLIFSLLDLFDELNDIPVLLVGNIDFIIILTAFHLMLYNNMIRININFLLNLKDLRVVIIRNLVNNFTYVIYVSYPICFEWCLQVLDLWFAYFSFLGCRSLYFSILIGSFSAPTILIFIFNFLINC